MKTNHLGIILGFAVLLSPCLTAYSTDTIAQPIENTTAPQSPEQKTMTPEEEKMIETIKDIFQAMAEPGITPKALAKRFGELDPKYESGRFSFPFNKSFSKIEVTESDENSNIVNSIDLELTPNTLLSIDSLQKNFGNYKRQHRLHWNNPQGIIFNTKIPELQEYTSSLVAECPYDSEDTENPKFVHLILYLIPDE